MLAAPGSVVNSVSERGLRRGEGRRRGCKGNRGVMCGVPLAASALDRIGAAKSSNFTRLCSARACACTRRCTNLHACVSMRSGRGCVPRCPFLKHKSGAKREIKVYCIGQLSPKTQWLTTTMIYFSFLLCSLPAVGVGVGSPRSRLHFCWV